MVPEPTRRGVLLAAAATAASGLALPAAVAAQAPAPLRWGVNYTPSGPWWRIWQQWDAGRVERDLTQVRGLLGVDHIRIQLPWVMFQPRPGMVDATLVRHLQQMVDIAHDLDLKVCVAAMTAWLSGRPMVPEWAEDLNWLTHPAALSSQHLLFDTLARALHGHPGILGIDLGNELLAGHVPATSDAAFDRWANRQLATVRRRLHGQTHTVSTFGWPVPQKGHLAATLGDATVVHSWDFRPGIARGRSVHFDAAHMAEYLIEAFRAYHQRAGRPLWLQETGVPMLDTAGKSVVEPALAPAYVHQLIANALTCRDLYGITWWCSHDVDSRVLPGYLPVSEYSLGLITRDGTLKPSGRAFAEAVREQRAGRFAPPVPTRTVAVVGDDRGAFDKLLARGVRPTFVRPEHARDRKHLGVRGITKVVRAASL